MSENVFLLIITTVYSAVMTIFIYCAVAISIRLITTQERKPYDELKLTLSITWAILCMVYYIKWIMQ